MQDFKLDIEVTVKATPVNHRFGPTYKGPEQKESFTEKQTQITTFTGTKVDIKSMVNDCILAISRQWQLTSTEPPRINVDEASLIGKFDATVTGQVDAQGVSTVVTLEWGVTQELGSSLAATESPLSGADFAGVTFPLIELQNNTLFYYRIKAVSANGTAYSFLKSFKTAYNPIQMLFDTDLGSGITKYNNGCIASVNGKIFASPYRDTAVLEIDPETDTVTQFGSLSTDINKWYHLVEAGDGLLYAMPMNVDDVLEVNPVTRAINTYPGATSPVAADIKWPTAVLAPNGNIYGIPNRAKDIIEFNPTTKGINLFGDFADNVAKWSKGILANDGKIYAGPIAGETSMLEIDPTVPSATKRELGLTGGANYNEIYNSGEKIFLIPINATGIGVFNIYTKVFHTIGNFPVSDTWNGAVIVNDKIYLIPRTATYVVEVDIVTESYITFGNVGGGLIDWNKGVLSDNGKIYAFPAYINDTLLEIDPVAKTAIETEVIDSASSWRWPYNFKAANGNIYGIPQDVNHVAKLTL